mmetsp:Transcript_17171/g.28719  ORF Transcript_17171/g.28719 Transcript_17171/m.28719 type:complete len:940 (+) Transcript_17171:63-2882(+)
MSKATRKTSDDTAYSRERTISSFRLSNLVSRVQEEEDWYLKQVLRNATYSHEVDMSRIALKNLGSKEYSGLRFPPVSEVVPPSADVIPNIFAGVIAALKLILGMVVFASLIFTDNDTLDINLAVGINVMLLSCGISLFINSLFSRMPFSLASPQDSSTILLALMARAVVNGVDHDYQIVPTLLWLQAINAGLCAFCFFISYIFDLANLVLLLPYPVLCAFLGAIGVAAMRGALATMSGVSFVYLWPTNFTEFFSLTTMAQVGCGLLFFSGMIRMGDIKNYLRRFFPSWFIPLVSLLYMFLFPLAFWVIVYSSGYSSAHLIDTGWLYEASDSAKFSSMWDNYKYSDVNWKVLYELLVSSLSMTLLVWVSSMLNITGIEASAFPKGIDKDGEMLNLGLCNLICCLAGGAPVFHQLGTSIQCQMDGGSHRLASMVSAVVVLGVWFAGAASTIQRIVPRFFLGGIFLTIGWSFFGDWLIKSKNKMSSVEYRLLLFCVVFFIALRSILIAIGAAVAIALGVFLLRLSSTGGVKSIRLGSSHRSCCARTSEEEKVLDKHGNRIMTVKLAGVLFFGSVQTIVYRVREAIRQECAQYIVLDFEETLYMDASSAENFKKLYLEVKGAGGLLFFVNLTIEQIYGFLRIGILPVNSDRLVIAEKSQLLEQLIHYKTNTAVHEEKGFDQTMTWIFGNGLEAFSQYPYFQEESRAKELCEDDILHRFLYSEMDSRPGVMAEEVFKTKSSDKTEPIAQTPHERSVERMSKLNISDEMFFQLPLCLGFLPTLQEYVEVRNYNNGDCIFSDTEKRKSECFVIIRQGLLEYREVRGISSCSPGRRLAAMGAGHLTRAGSFLSHMGHLADYVAVVDNTILWTISRDAMQRISDKDPALLTMVFSNLGLSCARQNHLVSGVRYGEACQYTSYVGYEYFQLQPPVSDASVRGISLASGV